MCDYITIANCREGLIVWCPTCKVYNLQFQTVVMTLDKEGFDYFKNNIADCYQNQLKCSKCPNYNRRHKDILFKTQVEGMRLCFSMNEVATLLAMIQEAELVHYGMLYS